VETVWKQAADLGLLVGELTEFVARQVELVTEPKVGEPATRRRAARGW